MKTIANKKAFQSDAKQQSMLDNEQVWMFRGGDFSVRSKLNKFEHVWGGGRELCRRGQTGGPPQKGAWARTLHRDPCRQND